MKKFMREIISAGVNALFVFALVVAWSVAFVGVYFLGYAKGFDMASTDAEMKISSLLSSFDLEKREVEKEQEEVEPTQSTPVIVALDRPPPPPAWTGPELWDVVNTRRVEFGVNPLKQRDELCTIASIRLNELLDLGKLDGHEGFSSLPDRRTDLAWIYETYNLSEFLLSGAQSPQEAVNLWENTLGHRKLLTGGEYSWGCVYAQNSFAVAIAAF